MLGDLSTCRKPISRSSRSQHFDWGHQLVTMAAANHTPWYFKWLAVCQIQVQHGPQNLLFRNGVMEETENIRRARNRKISFECRNWTFVQFKTKHDFEILRNVPESFWHDFNENCILGFPYMVLEGLAAPGDFLKCCYL